MSMKMLMNPNREILAVLTEQPVFVNNNYRLLIYCLVENVGGGKVLFNDLTRAYKQRISRYV